MNQSVHLLNLIGKEKLDEILCAFTEITGIAAIISDADGRPITDPQNFTNLCQNYCRSTEKGRHKCYKSDSYGGRKSARLKKCVMHDCLNAGLLDAASPIVVGENHLDNILYGQFLEKHNELSPQQSCEVSRRLCSATPIIRNLFFHI